MPRWKVRQEPESELENEARQKRKLAKTRGRENLVESRTQPTGDRSWGSKPKVEGTEARELVKGKPRESHRRTDRRNCPNREKHQ